MILIIIITIKVGEFRWYYYYTLLVHLINKSANHKKIRRNQIMMLFERPFMLAGLNFSLVDTLLAEALEAEEPPCGCSHLISTGLRIFRGLVHQIRIQLTLSKNGSYMVLCHLS